MTDDNIILYAATYLDHEAATADYEDLKELQDRDFEMVGAVVVSKDAAGAVKVRAHKDGVTGGIATVGGGAGLIVGLFAPPLLASIAVGAAAGAVIGHFIKRHEEKEIGFSLDEYLPVDSSAVLVLIEDKYLDRVEKSLAKADKKISKAIDKDDAKQLEKALEDSAVDIEKAINS